MNAVGVLAKVDLSDALVQQRHELASKIAKGLEGRLTTVVPISAALDRAHVTVREALQGMGLY